MWKEYECPVLPNASFSRASNGRIMIAFLFEYVEKNRLTTYTACWHLLSVFIPMTNQAITGKPVHREQKQINLCCPGMLLGVVMLSLCVQGFAQESAPPKLPEEIIVNAPESLKRLQTQVKLAQKRMFNVFNKINDDDQFDVHCTYDRRWQSKIREQVCTPNYIRTVQKQEVQLMLGQFGMVGAEKGFAGNTQIGTFNARFEEIMKTQFIANPEFREALLEYQSLTEQLDGTMGARLGRKD